MSDVSDDDYAPGWRFPLDSVRALYAYDHDAPLAATVQPSGARTGMVVEQFAITPSMTSVCRASSCAPRTRAVPRPRS